MTTDIAVVHLALSPGAAQALKRHLACEFRHYEDTELLEKIAAELDSQLGGLTPTPTPVAAKTRAQDVAEQMAAAGAAAVTTTPTEDLAA